MSKTSKNLSAEAKLNQEPSGKKLHQINFPSDLKKLNENDLISVCAELRQFIIESVSQNPGHLASSLGVVELAVALHYVFNTPYDKIIWDVGHQAYTHKILTGRKELFHTNRRYKGISGFPRTEESEYDAFGTGHSSTSISACTGMAIAARFNNEKDRHHIAVIGDGAMTAGIVFEAINHAGYEKPNLLVILNDNNYAIDPNVGAIKDYITDISTSRSYNKLKDEVWNILSKFRRFGPKAQWIIQRVDTAVKSILLKQSNFFEALNFRYFGPIDGHDVIRLVKVLKDLKRIKGPKLLHIRTVKGKGFESAEKNQTLWHFSPGVFDSDTGEILETDKKDSPPLYQEVFGNTLLELAEQNPKIIGVTPAMATGCSMNIMMEKFPHRVFDVGIAEQHAVTFSAGLAIGGLIPFCNIYSTFLQRAYDQLIHDVALQKLQVIFCIDRAGLVGADGATHHGSFDIAYLRCIPNLIVSAPMDEIELRNLMYTAQLKNYGPFAIRYPKGRGVTVDWKKPFKEIPIGKARKLRDGDSLAILTIGNVGNYITEITEKLEAENIDFAHYDMRFVKPIDEEVLHDVFQKFNKVITIEDGVITGGFGSAVIEFMIENNYQCNIKRLGIPDRFIEHGTPLELHTECGYHPDGIYKAIKEMLGKSVKYHERSKNRKVHTRFYAK